METDPNAEVTVGAGPEASRGPIRECPKHMVFGPCGGVDETGGCEVDQRSCPFLEAPSRPRWTATVRRPRRLPLGRFVADLRPSAEPGAVEAAARRLHEAGAAVLLGEHLDDPRDEPLVETAGRIAATGCRVLATVTGRGRGPAEALTRIEDLLGAGVTAVHVVTGDHPAARFGPGHTAHFGIDGVRLADLARSAGALVSVAESPASPPVDARVDRLVDKQRAGADLAVLNHAGSPADVTAFTDRATSAGVELEIVAPVPVVTDRRSAEALVRFPGLRLPAGHVESVLAAADPRRAGIDAAIASGVELLGSGRFAGINLSGSAGDVGLEERAAILAEIIGGVTARVPVGGPGEP